MKTISLYLIINSFLFLSLNTFGQVHVGDGGGEAENIVLDMALGVPYWAKACNENLGLCGNFVFSNTDISNFFKKIEFKPANQIQSHCLNNSITISHESLYLQLDKPRRANDLAEILIKTMLYCAGHRISELSGMKFNLDPRMRVGTFFLVHIFAGINGDVITSHNSFSNAQQNLVNSMKCRNFRVLSWLNDKMSIHCYDNNLRYLVQIKQNRSDLEFISRIEYED